MDSTINKPILAKETEPTTALTLFDVRNKSANWQKQVKHDSVVTEAPLQISLCWSDEQGKEQEQIFAVVMRTPGDDKNLVLGLLLTELVISNIADVSALRYQTQEQSEQFVYQNQIDVVFKPGCKPNNIDAQRSFSSSSSCGICGKTSIQQLELNGLSISDEAESWLPVATLSAIPDTLKQAQALFDITGSIHGAALFSADGSLLFCCEDVGRHNAVDKLIGRIHSNNTFLKQCVLVVSGRVSFELMQKCLVANIPIIAAVGAPTSLAVATAKQFNITLVGFCFSHRMNIYHGDWRINIE